MIQMPTRAADLRVGDELGGLDGAALRIVSIGEPVAGELGQEYPVTIAGEDEPRMIPADAQVAVIRDTAEPPSETPAASA